MNPLHATRPISIQMDASSHCQLACPLCPTADGRTKAGLGAGHLKLADFEALLDRNPQIAHVELSNYGEMFLNPQLPEILACAFERQVAVSGSNGVNLNFAREEALEAVVKYRVRSLTCSIDGASEETYSRYRVNGNLTRVLGHIDKIREYRARQGSAFPLLDWQFVVFGHNEHEVPAARAMAAARGMNFVPRLSWDAGYSPVRNAGLVRLETGLPGATREEYQERRGAAYTRDICFQLWNAPVVNWNGALLGCCVNYWADFGANVFTAGLAEAMANPRLEYARRMLTGEAEARDGIPCSTCDQYLDLRKRQDWLTPEEIQQHSGVRYVAGVVPRADPAIRFAQISIVAGTGSPRVQTSGRLFRFGVDTAVYFAPEQPGTYTIFIRPLGPGGWLPSRVRQLEVAALPVCQEFHVDLNEDAPHVAEGAKVDLVPAWIR
jgi:hypothetical protein